MMLTRLILRIALLLVAPLLAYPAHAQDDISAAGRSVVRVVTVALVDGEVVGFGHGSGFAVSPTRIVTNAHVVESAVRYPGNVVLGVVPSEGQKSYPARLIAVDAARDLALIEISEGRVPPTAIYSGPFASGMDVAALGYPGNVDLATAQSAQDYITPRVPVRSEGNVSNVQQINGTAALLHTASIARGNSGGPLVDDCGRVVGVNTFITRADEGDSPFGFAIANRELTRFLTEAQQSYTAIGTACVSMADADARDRAARDAAASAAARAAAEADARTNAAQAESLNRARATAQASRENHMALAALLLVLAGVSAVAALLFQQKGDARKVRFSAIGAGVLLTAALLAFFLRPDPAEVRAAPPAPTPQTPEAKVAARTDGAFLCRILPDRSRVTVSATTDVPFSITSDGCVNDRTQYARSNTGAWQRILVPNEDAAVAVLSFDGSSREYRAERYLLDADAMAAARAARAGLSVKACTTDPAAVAQLTERQAAIRATLPSAPNERLVYQCEPAR